MTNRICVRAEFGSFTKQFVEGGYVAIGWMPNTDLSAVKSRDGLYPLYKQAHPDDTSNIVIGQQVGRIARFRSAGHSSSDQLDPKLAFSRRTIWRSAGRRRVTREVAA